MKFNLITYKDLNARQKECYNFHKAAGVLADYGFTSIRLSDDWEGADFIAQHIDGITFIKVQLKARLTFDEKYRGKNIWICFLHNDSLYLYPHDETFDKFLSYWQKNNKKAWKRNSKYHFPSIGKDISNLIKEYSLASAGKESCH